MNLFGFSVLGLCQTYFMGTVSHSLGQGAYFQFWNFNRSNLYSRNCHLKYWHDSLQEIGLYAWVADDKYFSLWPLKIIFFSALFYRVLVMHWNKLIHVFKSWNDQSLKYETIQGLSLLKIGRRLELSLKTLRYFIPTASEKYPQL